jgi:hypothetical protein
MKNLFFFIVIFLLFDSIYCQTQITLTFQAKDSITQNPLGLDSVYVMNLTENSDTTLYDSVSVLTMNAAWPVGIEKQSFMESESFVLVQNVPNPFRESTFIRIYMKNDGVLDLAVYDNQGKKLSGYRNEFTAGWHLFRISTQGSQQMHLRVSDDKITKTIKILNAAPGNEGEQIFYQGPAGSNLTALKSSPDAGGFIFYLGNHLRYSAYVDGYQKRILLDNPVSSKTYTFTMLAFTCGDFITIDHVAGDIAPVDKTVTYSTVTNIPGLPSKCWITSNLGADHQATVVSDNTEASAGWYWQFNRKQGYKHDGTTRKPNTNWISSIIEYSDWTPANDPCTLELGSGWRIPTSTEWNDVDAGGNWTDWNGPWNSALKIHAAGYLISGNGSLGPRGEAGYYMSSSQYSYSHSHYLYFANSMSDMSIGNKASGYSLRCLRDN